MAVVRRASAWVDCCRIECRVEARVLREVIPPVRSMHRSWVPVHPRAGSGLVVLQGILGMPALSADSQRWRSLVKLHFPRSESRSESWLAALH